MTDEPTVFVVDDNPGLRRSLQALLEAAGVPVETYASAPEFLERWDRHRPGCLVLDVRLPGSSGLDLQEELRRLKVPVPIIVLTAYADVPTSVRALKGGAFDFLQKPFPPKKLLERIRAALETDRQARAVTVERDGIVENIARLTPREREIMDLLALGHSSKEIATTMKISSETPDAVLLRIQASGDVEPGSVEVRFAGRETVVLARDAMGRPIRSLPLRLPEPVVEEGASADYDGDGVLVMTLRKQATTQAAGR